MRKTLASITQKFRFSSICALCNQYHHHTQSLCEACMSYLVPLKSACIYCAHPLPDSSFLVCGNCIQTPPFFDETWVAYKFEEPLRSLIHQFKYHKALYLTSFLTHLMQHALKENLPPIDCLIPVPMHPLRLKIRGFNQAALLTKSLARQIKKPYDLHLCQKIINTPPQASLNAEQRKKNLKHAFQVPAMPYQHVVLIDDLLTTGNTVNELARLIKAQGVARVTVWCVARTHSDRHCEPEPSNPENPGFKNKLI